MDYTDFVVRISPGAIENQYTVTAHSVQTTQVTQTFTLPVTPQDFEHFVATMGARTRGKRGLHSMEWDAAKVFGEKLFDAVIAGKVHTAYTTCLNDAMRRRQGLRLKLILDASALADYPWEFLYDASNAQFPALFENTPLVRFLELPEAMPPLAVTPPLSILAGIASPRDYEPLDTERERDNLTQALAPLMSAGQITLDWLSHLTLETLRQQLLAKEYHIFHFIGHGGFDSKHHDGLLVLEDEQGHSNQVSGERLAVVLGNHRSLRMAVLNACEGARTSPQDPFAGTATTLVRTGDLPAVLAMQFAISDDAAINFASGFYGALAAGRPIDAAVAQGRQAIFTGDNDTEWATPVLYLRAPDGKIFALQAPSGAPEHVSAKPIATTGNVTLPTPPSMMPERATPTRVRAEMPRTQKRPSWLGSILLVLMLCALIAAVGYLISNFSLVTNKLLPAAATNVSAPLSNLTATPGALTQVTNTKSVETIPRSPVPALFPTNVPTPEPELLTTVNLSANPGWSSEPQIVVDAKDIVHVVWQDQTPNPTRNTPSILHRQLQKDRTWSPAEILYDGSANLGVYNLRTLTDLAGHACVYWVDIKRVTYLRCQADGTWGAVSQFEGDNTLTFAPDGSVQAVRFSPNAIYFGNPQISDPFSAAIYPQFVIDSRGVYHVVWGRVGKNPYESVEYRASSDGGKTWSAQTRLSDEKSKFVEYPRMIGDAQGNLHLVWNADGGFYYRHWTPAEGWSDAVDIRATAEDGNLIGLAADAQSQPHVIWESNGIIYTRQNEDGTWSAPRRFTNPVGWHVGASNLAVGADGTRYLAWHDDETDDIFFARLGAE